MASLCALARASAIRPPVWPLAMLGSLVGGSTGDSPGAETPGWTQSSWSSIPHCLDVRQVVCCSRSTLESPTWCSSGTGPHPAFDGGYSSCSVMLFVACQSPQPSLVPGRAQRQRNLLGLRKGIHTLVDWSCFDRHLSFDLCCCRLLLPLVFLRHRRRAERGPSCSYDFGKTMLWEMEIGALDSHHAYHIGVDELLKGYLNG